MSNFTKTKALLEGKEWTPKIGDLVRHHGAPKGKQLGKVREIYKGKGKEPTLYRVTGSGWSVVLTSDKFSKED